MRQKTSIIIVTYNAIQWISKCLSSIEDYPVILIDNNSTDNTVEFVESYFPNIQVIEQDENLGFGKANNIGISLALNGGAEHVFLLNQDAYLTEGCIESLESIQKNNLKYGILSPLHLNGSGEGLDENFSNYISYPIHTSLFSDSLLGKTLKEIYDVSFVNAAGWLCSKECLEKVGGFDPIFFHYGEDENYCQRVSYHGFKIGVVPTAKILHDRGNNTKKKDIAYDSLTHLKIMERRWKMKYANVNYGNLDEFEELIKERKKYILRSLLKLRFKSGSFYLRELRLLQHIRQPILDSIKKNQEEGPVYLGLD